MEETGKEKRYSRDPEANQIKKRDRRRKKGSLTVEASLIVPLCVIILTFLLSLTFYVYLRCWYTQAGCEVSVQGSGYGVLEGRTGQEKAEKKWKTKRQIIRRIRLPFLVPVRHEFILPCDNVFCFNLRYLPISEIR